MKKIMKTPMILLLVCTVTFFAGFLTVGCSSTGSEHEEKHLIDFRFTQSTYSANQALVLQATLHSDFDPEHRLENTLTVHLTTSSGASSTEQLSPWSDVTDNEMLEAIKNGPGSAILRIKESGQESARNSQGELVRSEEAMNRFKEWIETKDKLSIWWVSQLQPDIVIEFLEEPTVPIVNEIRNHKNVEFMEPSQYGEYLSVSTEPAIRDDFVLIIIPEHLFTYSAGETVTATFQQTDGTVLEASVPITE